MSLDAAAVARIARLARIRLNEGEQTALAAELSHVLGWVEELQKVDTQGVEPMTSVVGARQRLRPDIAVETGGNDAVLANATDSVAGFYTVPKVVE